MRLSSLSLAVILLFSSVVFAQHATPSAAPSAPPPSPTPSAAPSPAPAPNPAPTAPSPPPSFTPSASVSHNAPPSNPTPSAPVSHVEPSATPSPSHGFSATSTDSNSGRIAPVVRTPESDARRVIPEQKVPDEGRIVPAPRIGENPPEKAPRPGEPDVQRRICRGASCPEPQTKPDESDLRHRICLNGPCTCPAGQTSTKGGCAPVAVVEQCQPGQVWNGGACVASPQCQAGEYWNGANCSVSSVECAGLNGRAAILIAELQSLSSRVRQACSDDPVGQDCMARKQEQEGAVQRYRMLLSEASAVCRAALPDPAALI
jgi:hypothetical protein